MEIKIIGDTYISSDTNLQVDFSLFKMHSHKAVVLLFKFWKRRRYQFQQNIYISINAKILALFLKAFSAYFK